MLGSLMGTCDWAASRLGTPSAWPPALQTVAGLMLRSKTPVFVAWGPDLCLLYNDAYADILGPRHPAALGQPLYAVWSELRAAIEPLVNQALAGEAVSSENAGFMLCRDAADEQVWFSFSYTPIDGPDGPVAGVYCTLSETTASVLAERRRRTEADWRYRLFDQAPSLMAVVRGPDHVYELANRAYQQLAGCSAVVGKPFCALSQKTDGQDCGALLDRVRASGTAFTGRRLPVRFWQPSGGLAEPRFIDLVLQPITSPDGGVSGVLIAGNDVTALVRAEDALQASQRCAQQTAQRLEAQLRETVAKHHKMANALPQIVWGAQSDGHHDYFNQQWYDYTGIAQGSGDGEGWRALFHPDDQALITKKWQHSLATGQPYEIEYRLRNLAGQYRWVLGRARPVRNGQGVISRWMGTCTDIHEQRLAQERLQTSDRLKDEFLAMLAHELRNPLAPIMTAADLLSRSTLDEKGVGQLSEVIGRQARHMTRLIDDLLDASRVTRGQVSLDAQPADMNSIAAEAIEQIRPLLEAKAHHLDLQLSPAPAMVLGDRLRLVQVLVNVLGNAIRYTASGGRIALQLAVQGGQLMLSVKDNGVGMSGELLEVAFELFSQGERSADRSQGGLGIGLALVRSLVQLHGGSVMLRSAGLGLGSELTILLPGLAAGDGPQPADAEEASAASAGRPLRILVVDDNADAARLLGMFLELLGHEVHVQFHPAAAIDCARQVLPDLCLLDIGLPDMDGYALARQLRLIPGLQTAVLAAVTGYSQPRDKRAALAAGFDFHFAKPIDSQQLQAWLAGIAAPLAVADA